MLPPLHTPKVYFGKKADGSVADIDQMTYAEVVLRMVELMWVPKRKDWIDFTYRIAVFDMLTRAVERLSPTGSVANLDRNEVSIRSNGAHRRCTLGFRACGEPESARGLLESLWPSYESEY